MIAKDFLQPAYDFNPVIVQCALEKVRSELEVMEDLFYSPKLQCREGIIEFGEYIENLPDALGEDPFPLFHTFSDGLYTREMHAPKGYAIVGKIHRHEHLVHLTKGSILVVDETGTKKLEAPATFVSKAGIKRIGYTIEDVAWMDIHKTDASTVNEVEKEIFVSSYKEYEEENNIIEGELSWQE